MEWFLWVLVGYYVINLVLLPGQTEKTQYITKGSAALQALLWIGFIIGLMVTLLL